MPAPEPPTPKTPLEEIAIWLKVLCGLLGFWIVIYILTWNADRSAAQDAVKDQRRYEQGVRAGDRAEERYKVGR